MTVAGKVSGRATIELVAFVPGDPLQGPLTLRVMPATRGRTEAGAPAGLVAALQGQGGAVAAQDEQAAAGGQPAVLRRDGVFWSGAGALELAYVSPPAPASAATAVVVARAGIGVTVGDAELRGRARLVWELRRGSIDAVSFRAEGVGADLEVTGVGVRAVQRSGSGVRVELQAPVSGRPSRLVAIVYAATSTTTGGPSSGTKRSSVSEPLAALLAVKAALGVPSTRPCAQPGSAAALTGVQPLASGTTSPSPSRSPPRSPAPSRTPRSPSG